MKTTFDNGTYSVAKISAERNRNIVGTMMTGVWGVYDSNSNLIVTQGLRKTAINVANQLKND